MQLEEYMPACQLIKQDNENHKPKYPVIESHGHIGHWNTSPPSPEEPIDRTDEAGFMKCLDLDAGVTGAEGLVDRINIDIGRYPDLFDHAAGIDWSLCLEGGNSYSNIAVTQIHEQHRAGA